MLMKLGEWLRQQRQARGWSQREMARRLIQAGRACGDNAMPALDSMYRNVHRWESGQTRPLERFELYYCQALGIPADQFAIAPPAPASANGNTPPPAPPASPVTGPAEPAATAALTRFAVEREVSAAAHESSDHAGQYEQHRVGEVTFDQLHADLRRLARLSDTGEPFPVFLETRRVRDRTGRLLDRRPWPREETDLHFLLGCLNGLMGIAAGRLGYPDAAEELIRAGLASATVIDHRPLQGQLRRQLSTIMYWRGSFQESRAMVLSGLECLPDGPMAALLHLQHARTEAKLGDADATRQAVRDAHRAHDRDVPDDLLDVGGEFSFSWATHHALAGAALTELGGPADDAAAELEQAISLYEKGPAPGEEHWFAGQPLAGIDLAVVRLRSGALDAAVAALEPALSLPATQRITQVTTRLAAVRDELAAPIFRSSPQARDLSGQIKDFSRQTILAGLP